MARLVVSDRLSNDGKTLLFEEEGEGAGNTYAIYVRGTDESAAIRLGEGRALSLAPDGKSVLGLNRGSLVVLPIGAGTSRTLSLGSLICQNASFLPDGKPGARDRQRAGQAIPPVSDGTTVARRDRSPTKA